MIWSDSGIYALKQVRIPISNIEHSGYSSRRSIETNTCVSKQEEKFASSKSKLSTRCLYDKSKIHSIARYLNSI